MTLVAAFFMGFIVIVPILFICRLLYSFDLLNERKFKSRFGAFYEDLKLSTGKRILLQPSFFLVRRFILVAAILLVENILIVQIFMMASQIIIQVIIIGSNVFGSKSREKTEYFNEIVLMMSMYTMFVFSPWVTDVYVVFYFGYIVIAIVVTHLLINLGIILVSTIKTTISQCKRRFALAKYKKQRKARQAEFAKGREQRK